MTLTTKLSTVAASCSHDRERLSVPEEGTESRSLESS
jgi:hypothetical protein